MISTGKETGTYHLFGVLLIVHFGVHGFGISPWPTSFLPFSSRQIGLINLWIEILLN